MLFPYSQILIMFRYFDQDKSGSLKIDEFRNLYNDLKRYGIVEEESPEEAIRKLDKDGSGTVEFNEYMDWLGLYEQTN